MSLSKELALVFLRDIINNNCKEATLAALKDQLEECNHKNLDKFNLLYNGFNFKDDNLLELVYDRCECRKLIIKSRWEDRQYWIIYLDHPAYILAGQYVYLNEKGQLTTQEELGPFYNTSCFGIAMTSHYLSCKICDNLGWVYNEEN